MVKARDRNNENQAKRWHANSVLIKIYRNDSSALNPDEVSRAEDLIKERDRNNEKRRTRYHAQCAAAKEKDEALHAAAKDLDEKWTCDVCKSCSYQLPCLLGPTF